MTREVVITIKGTQLEEEEASVIMTAPGTYHLTNGKHYLHYEESIEGSEDISKNTIKISSERVVLMKKGIQTAQMIFDLTEADLAVYQTPYGNLTFQTETKLIKIHETQTRLEILMEYALYNDSTKLSDNRLNILVEATPPA